MSAIAKDDVAVTKVEFSVDGQLVYTDTSSPYAYTWTAPKKLAWTTHKVTARAYDGRGGTATSSVTVTRATTRSVLSAKARARAAKRRKAGRTGSARRRDTSKGTAARRTIRLPH
jgi:hypothetical protein